MLMRLALVPTAEVAGLMVRGEAAGLVEEDSEDTKSSGHHLYTQDVQVDLA